jgi:two-component system chemotaxis response regulator CheY
MNESVLVVDDSPTMRQMILFALRRIGSLVIDEAADGVEALKKVKSKQYDLIITDINMPMMDGLKLVSLVRQDSNYDDVPIVIVTTEGGQADRDRAFALGANEYFKKPIQAPTVAKKVKELLSIT